MRFPFALMLLFLVWHSLKKRKDSLKTRAEMSILCTYVENQAILELILLYRASKCKQTKEQGSNNCLWICIFTFLCGYCQFIFFFLARCKQKRIKLCYIRLQYVKKHKLAMYKTQSGEPNYLNHKFF